MAVKRSEGEWVNGRNQVLHTLTYRPAADPTACLMFHHGYGEHSGRYQPVFDMLAKAGIAVFTYDAHGHGRSEPKEEWNRHLIWDFQHMVNDWAAYAASVRAQFPAGTPFFIGGHSMGALTSILVVLQDQFLWQGLVCCSATVDVEWTWFLRLQASIGGVLATIIPRARIVPAVKGEDMSTDPQAVQEMEEDPLNASGNVRARTGNEFLKAFRRVFEREHELQLPIYAHHGAGDRLANLSAVRRMLRNAQSRDVTLNIIPGGFHEVMMGTERTDVTLAIIDWLSSQCAHGHAPLPPASRAPSPQADVPRSSVSSEDSVTSGSAAEEEQEQQQQAAQQPLPHLRAGMTASAQPSVGCEVPAAAPVVVASAVA